MEAVQYKPGKKSHKRFDHERSRNKSHISQQEICQCRAQCSCCYGTAHRQQEGRDQNDSITEICISSRRGNRNLHNHSSHTDQCCKNSGDGYLRDFLCIFFSLLFWNASSIILYDTVVAACDPYVFCQSGLLLLQ